MNSDELYTLKSMVLDNYEQYHDGLRILLESDKGLYKAFGQSPRTKYLKTENFYGLCSSSSFPFASTAN